MVRIAPLRKSSNNVNLGFEYPFVIGVCHPRITPNKFIINVYKVCHSRHIDNKSRPIDQNVDLHI